MQKNLRTKKCPTCGTENSIHNQFCKKCGARLSGSPRPVVRICHSCGAKNDAQNYKCLQCGAILEDIPAEFSVQLMQDVEEKKEETHFSLIPYTPAYKSTKQRRRWFIFITVILFVILCIAALVTYILSPKVFPNTALTPSIGSTVPNNLGEFKAPNGAIIGVNDGSYAPFDVWHSEQEVALKQLAAQKLRIGDEAGAISLWQSALKIDSSDAEALIYIENQRVLASGEPYLTLIAETAFISFSDSSPESQLQGIYVAQHEYNSGSSPYKLRILVANSGQEVSSASLVAQQIAHIASQDKTIVGVIGWPTSSRSYEALSILANAKLPQVSPQASDDGLSGISPYFFRIIPPNKVQAQEAAQFAEKILHIKNPVVFLDPGDNYSQNLANDFEAQFMKDGYPRPLEETFITDKTKDFSSLIQDAVNKYHPDAFYFTSDSKADTALFQDALPTSGQFATLPVISGDSGYVAHKNSYNRWFFTAFAYPDAWNLIIRKNIPPFFQDYISDFNPDGQKPDGYYGYTRADESTILSYDATQVLLTGIQMALADGKTTPTSQDVAAALPKITGAQAYQGVSGQIAFDVNHDPINKAVLFLYTSADGHLQMKSYQGCFVKGCS